MGAWALHSLDQVDVLFQEVGGFDFQQVQVFLSAEVNSCISPFNLIFHALSTWSFAYRWAGPVLSR